MLRVVGDLNLVPDQVFLLLVLTRSTMGLREEKEEWRAVAGAFQRGPPEEEGRDQRREELGRRCGGCGGGGTTYRDPEDPLEDLDDDDEEENQRLQKVNYKLNFRFL